MQDSSIEFIARGMMIGPHGVLLCRAVGKDNTFLPGGHVEFGEQAAAALIRELHIEYLWQPVNGLADANLLPKPLRALIPQWTRGKHAPWSSDIRD